LTVRFYYRENCHLCDAMRKALVTFNIKVHPVNWLEIDIDRDLDLIRLYDTKVPVLCVDDSEICHYFLDSDALRAAISQ